METINYCRCCNMVKNWIDFITIYSKGLIIWENFMCDNCIELNNLDLITCNCYYGKNPLQSKKCKLCSRTSYNLTKPIKVIEITYNELK